MNVTREPGIGAADVRLIRRYRDDDLPAFEVFWADQGGRVFASRKVQAFRRLVEGNPFSRTRDDYLVLEQGGRVAAYEGLMPFRFSISGRSVDGLVYHDTLVDPQLRGRGTGSGFVNSLVRLRPEFSLAVWMNAPNSRVFEKCGWLPVRGLYTYARGYTLKGMVNTRVPLINTIVERAAGALPATFYRMEKALWRHPGKDYSIEFTDRFDKRIDTLFHSVKHLFPFLAYRTHRVLNWKFADSPWSRFGRMVCTRGDEALGYLVFKTRDARDEGGRKIATIYDFLCSPGEINVFRQLLRRAILEIEKTRPDTLEVMCTDGRFARVLTRMGFMRARENPGALKYIHAESVAAPAGISEGSGWFYTFGDGDKVFWDFDLSGNRA